MSRIYLIRHGATRANEGHLYCGSTDLSLSETGAAALRQLHYEIDAERYVTSGMKRTNETLRILFGAVPFREDAAFREVDFGAFEMRGYEELKDDPAYQAWLTGDNEENVPPGGESGAAMKARVLSAFAALASQPGDTVLITHGGVIAAIMEAFFPGEGKNRYQWQPQPGHGYAVTPTGYQAIP